MADSRSNDEAHPVNVLLLTALYFIVSSKLLIKIERRNIVGLGECIGLFYAAPPQVPEPYRDTRVFYVGKIPLS
ncbi:hypothetical protein FBY04_13312 [Pseudomonas sp. SJZ080]|nr:hypothetical protein FBY04_13312 [Pseudomonas sp. SJZ080]